MTENDFVPKNRLREAGVPYCGDYAMKLAKAGRFPTPVRLSPRRVGWFRSQLSAFLAEKRAA